VTELAVTELAVTELAVTELAVTELAVTGPRRDRGLDEICCLEMT
jgi:hypothetical protein